MTPEVLARRYCQLRVEAAEKRGRHFLPPWELLTQETRAEMVEAAGLLLREMAAGRPIHDWVWRAEIVRWIDGDSVRVEIDRGFEDYGKRALRLVGIDAAEVRGELRWGTRELARRATSRCLELARPGSQVLVRSHKPDKYGGRWLGEVWPADEAEQRSINRILLDEDLARTYPG